ncbi:Ca-transporting ATPase [Mycena floridula]|nr:Ca-transporting ATPase [Mycena floridula]
MANEPSTTPSVVIPDFVLTGADNEQPTSSPTPTLTLSPSSTTTAGLLSPRSPFSGARSSLDVPPSPTLTDNDTVSVPPSPTLTHQSSVHFQTTLALRDNKVDANSGTSSLGLLTPHDAGSSSRSHQRKLSNATFASSDGTEPDIHRSNDVELQYVKTNTTSVTHVDPSMRNSHDTRRTADSETAISEKGKKKRKAEEEKELAGKTELEQDADLDSSPFILKPFELAHMLDPKNLEGLEAIGGISGLLKGLGTSAESGLGKPAAGAGTGASQRHDPEKAVPAITLTGPAGDPKSTNSSNGDPFTASFEDRKRVYGENVLPEHRSKSLLQLMFAAMKDKVLILLSIAAVISLALGFYQDFGPKQVDSGPPVDWVEGVAIMVAIFIVVIVGSVNDWQKERQFKSLNDKKEERGVKVIRDGIEKVIDIKQVVVGDIALLEPGEIVPCDGVFISGHNVKCDESGATGESDAIKKLSYNECIELRDKARDSKGAGSAHTDCFVVSGSKVLEGVGKYVIVAVGQKSFNGRIMMALRGDTENTPLQLKLNALAELIAKLGSAAGLLLFVALLIKFFVQLGTGDPIRTPNQKGIAFVNILIISVTLIVVAVPEGLPLAVTLALAFATKRMTYEKLLVRVLGSCETMANASVVCTDKTGTLTQNVMTVVAGSVGIHAKFVRKLDENQSRTNADEAGSRKHVDDFSLDQSQLNTVLPPQLQTLFNEALSVNSTAFRDEDDENGNVVFVGSKTETALLKFAHELQWAPFNDVRSSAKVVQMVPFSSERKAMGVVMKIGESKWRLHLKGASEILSKKCIRHVVVHKDGAAQADEIETAPIDELAADNISRTIIFYANQMLRTISVCYRDFDSWPPANSILNDENEVSYDDLSRDLTLIAITGIEDPLREGVTEAVAKCTKAGVTVKMCTGDNVLTARSIAAQCGIFTKGGIIMEGPVFRKLSPSEMMEVVPRLQVLARSSPEDKKILVETLKRIGEIVGVTGDGTNDGPALKTANVGFSMGIAGTEVAKEASDIILMDDNFASIVKAIIWGRCVNDAVRKFLQFQISTNVTAVVITFVSAVASDKEESVLSAVQLLWINIIMDTFAALALATDPASEALLDRKPEKKTAPLFTVDMYKQILFQSAYQVIITLIFHFLGDRILGLNVPSTDRTVQTLVFNAFVFAQIFNSVNCRRLDRKLNVFEGISRNWYFTVITLIEIVVQIVIVFVGGAAFQVTQIHGREWGISLALGVVSIPLGVLIRLLPNEPFEWLFTRLGLLGRQQELPTTSAEAEEGWHGAISLVRDNLGTFANVRGGRVRSSSFVVKSRQARMSQELPPLRLSSLLTMAPTLMAGAVATGQAYLQNGSLSDPTHSDPSKSSAALWEGKLQLHPDTSPDDPVYQRFAGNQNTV